LFSLSFLEAGGLGYWQDWIQHIALFYRNPSTNSIAWSVAYLSRRIWPAAHLPEYQQVMEWQNAINFRSSLFALPIVFGFIYFLAPAVSLAELFTAGSLLLSSLSKATATILFSAHLFCALSASPEQSPVAAAQPGANRIICLFNFRRRRSTSGTRC